MLIILEGPDGGGKSTLVERFKASPSRPGWPKRVVSQLGGRTMTGDVMRTNTYDLVNRLRNGLLNEEVVLCERLHALSDLVYRGVFGGTPFLSRIESDGIFRDLGRQDVRFIYCRPPVQKVIDRGLLQAGDDTEEWLMEVAHKLRPLYDAYDAVMNRLSWDHGVPVVRYDYTAPSASEVEAAICAG